VPHFHGLVPAKPIPSYQSYKGTVFELVDQAVDFVLSKINLWVGTRAESVQVPIKYEIPKEVVTEAIVNAVAHRDYTSNGSIQVMLFADRLEIWNPGSLPVELTLDMLRHAHASFPHNPLLAEPLYLTKYIERMGTGTGDMIARCEAAGLPSPRFRIDGGCFVLTLSRTTAQVTVQVEETDKSLIIKILQDRAKSAGITTAQVTAQVGQQIIAVLTTLLTGDKSRAELQEAAGIAHREHFRKHYLELLLTIGWIERTIPDKPQSRLQRYRLTAEGRESAGDASF
jgi:ATP-dependent DNA helicase RecG